jgi:hypothetical protein
MAASASTGSARRELLAAAALLPALLLQARRAAATDYASAAEALAAIDALAAEADERLERLGAEARGARVLADSLRRDLRRHLEERGSLRQRLRLGPGAASGEGRRGGGVADRLDLEALREVLEKLAYACAESLPVLDDPFAVRVLAGQMVDVSRHLALVKLWIEAEERRG